jgi:hypothetical protein
MQTLSKVFSLFSNFTNLLQPSTPVVFGQTLQPDNTTIPQIIVKCKQYLENYGT